MKRIIYVLIAIVLFPLAAMGQRYLQTEQPFWVDGYFRELDNSYIEVVCASYYDLEGARDRAAKEVISRRSMATGTSASVSIDNNAISVSSGHEVIVKARVIDEYIIHHQGGYTVYQLVQTAKNPSYQYESVSVTDKYPFSPRVFVPGMSQLYKGSNVKGALFITGEIVAVGGVIVTECLRASYDAKFASTHNLSERKQYADKANGMANARNMFIAGAVAVYAWNVIDGIVAKGKQHIEIGRIKMRASPYASMSSAGMALNLNL